MPDDPGPPLSTSRHLPPPPADSPHAADTSGSRRTSSTVSTRSLRHPSSPSAESKTPLTPEESPPFTAARKRNVAAVEEEDKALDSASASPAQGRNDSGASGPVSLHVCICQPDPKIPRPRNAFILYRQHHQAKVIAQHPGLANPDISKIIGEQWRNQPIDVKNEWKALAEEEKLRHQQQYPTYRYQPKRNTRRGSLTDPPGSAGSDKAKCHKCGGRTILPPSSYASSPRTADSSSPQSAIQPQTPSSTTTPLSRTLPVLRELSLQSPAARRMGRPFPNGEMSPHRDSPTVDHRDDLGPLSSPDSKRRRFNVEQPVTLYRSMPTHYSLGGPVGPGTPFPFRNTAHPHPYPPAQAAVAHARRESLPGLRMLSPPGPMGPPPRPTMGYQQHRLSQGHLTHDRSLTLPPLQTGSAASQVVNPAPKPSDGKSADDVINSPPLSDKLEVLRRIAPPAPRTKTSVRGPLIAIEGDNVEAVATLARWLSDTLAKEDDMAVKLIDPPNVAPIGDNEFAMADYHVLAAEWLRKSKDLVAALKYTPLTSPPTGKAMASDDRSAEPASLLLAIDENRNDQDNPSPPETNGHEHTMQDRPDTAEDGHHEHESTSDDNTTKMDLDKPIMSRANTVKPVLLLPNFSLRATNAFAARIPIADVYSPKEHWQWSATLWRGVCGPDLTIYLRDAAASEPASRQVEQSEAERLWVVRRTRPDHGAGDSAATPEIEGATLRRVGFEVSEWVRAFGAEAMPAE